MSTDDILLVEDHGHVRTVVLNRPHRLNALTLASYEGLADILAAADADAQVRALVLRGAGRAFSSGADLTDLPSENLAGLTTAFRRFVDSLTRLGKPLVAAVQGEAVGLGMTMLLSCDIVLVAESARMRAPFVSLSTVPEAGSTWSLPRVVGAQRAAELLLTARWLTAGEAVSYGLAARVVPEDELLPEAMRVAGEIAGFDPVSVRATKRLLRREWIPSATAALAAELDEAARMPFVVRPW